MPKFSESSITNSRWLNAGYVEIAFKEPSLAALCKPGMFFELKAKTDAQERKLFKPISVSSVFEGQISFIIKVLGSGTQALAKLATGETLLALGPLGNSFPLVEDKNVLLVSGGVGWPPLGFLRTFLKEKNRVLHIHGGATATDIFPCDEFYTVDGSAGVKGLVTQNLVQILNEENIDIIYSCGPLPMIAAIQKVAGKIPHYASLEAYMACGVGAWYGCAFPVGESYQRVCADGPVFNAAEIRWEEL